MLEGCRRCVLFEILWRECPICAAKRFLVSFLSLVPHPKTHTLIKSFGMAKSVKLLSDVGIVATWLAPYIPFSLHGQVRLSAGSLSEVADREDHAPEDESAMLGVCRCQRV